MENQENEAIENVAYAIVFGATPSDLTQWKWNNSGTNADDGVNYVRPSDFTTAGVWAKAAEEAIEIP